MSSCLRPILPLLLLASLVSAQTNGVEGFDLTGLPPKATNFAEQRLMDMVEKHKAGDVQDAAAIQRTLAQYYLQKGDEARARAADERARSGEAAAASEGVGQSPSGRPRHGAPVAGEYVCRSMGSRPCDTQTTIALHADGTWGWRYFSGRYQVAGGQVTFEGVGLGSWGPAAIGPDTLTFTSGSEKVIYQKPAVTPARLVGVYVCTTAPGGCQTRIAIEMRPDGTWSWGADGGTYSMTGTQVKLSGLTSGPAGWGLCEIAHGALIFRAGNGVSEWRRRQ